MSLFKERRNRVNDGIVYPDDDRLDRMCGQQCYVAILCSWKYAP